MSSRYRGEDGTQTFGEWFDTLTEERQQKLFREEGEGESFEEFSASLHRRPERPKPKRPCPPVLDVLRTSRRSAMKKAFVEITNYPGAGGIHFYGRVRTSATESTDVEYTLTKALARRLNEGDRDFEYAEGDVTTRYFSKDDLLADAAEIASRSDCDILLEASRGTLNPVPVPWCRDAELGAELGGIGQQYEALYDETDDPWETHRDEARRLESLWDDAMGRLDSAMSAERAAAD